MIGLLPLGTASGVAEGIVLQRINELNAKIIQEAAARELPTLDVWRFNKDPARVDPQNGNLLIAGYS